MVKRKSTCMKNIKKTAVALLLWRSTLVLCGDVVLNVDAGQEEALVRQVLPVQQLAFSNQIRLLRPWVGGNGVRNRRVVRFSNPACVEKVIFVASGVAGVLITHAVVFGR